MSALERSDVARLAVLARIDMTDDDLDRLSGQLSAIVDAVATLEGVAGPDVPTTSHPIPMANVERDDVVEDVAHASRRALRRAGGARRSLPRSPDPWGGGMTDWTRATAAHMADALAAGEVTSDSAHAGSPRPHRGRRRRRARVPLREHRRGARHGVCRRRRPRRRRVASSPRGRADRHQGRPRHAGHAHHGGLAHPRGLDPSVRRDRCAQGARGAHAHPRQDQHGRVRDGLVHRALRVRPHAQPVGP